MTYDRHLRQQAAAGVSIHLSELNFSLTAATVFSAVGDNLFSQTWKVSLVVAYSSSKNVTGLLKSDILFQSLDFGGFRSLSRLSRALELPHLGFWCPADLLRE